MTSREVLIAVTGGIAAYKTAALVSQLVQGGTGVTVMMTRGAKEFVGPATFAALTGRPVAERMFDPEHYPLGPHIELARRAAVMCVAPATAQALAQFAHGFAGDLVATTYLCFTGPILVAPAMNREMWNKNSVRRNVERLQADGVRIIDPTEGWLSCRDQGAGRMAEPATILQAIEEALAPPI